MMAMKGNQIRINVQRSVSYVAISSTGIHPAYLDEMHIKILLEI